MDVDQADPTEQTSESGDQEMEGLLTRDHLCSFVLRGFTLF